MDRFNAMGRGVQLMLVGGVLLLISTFFNWQSVDVGPVDVGQNAWHGFWGVVMGLLTLVLIAWLVARLAGVDIPIPFSAAMIGAVLAVLILVFAVLKNLTDDYSSFWSVLGIIFAAAIVVGAWLEIQAAGGMDTLKSEMPKRGIADSSTSASAPPPTTPAPPPPPVSTEPAAPAGEPYAAPDVVDSPSDEPPAPEEPHRDREA